MSSIIKLMHVWLNLLENRSNRTKNKMNYFWLSHYLMIDQWTWYLTIIWKLKAMENREPLSCQKLKLMELDLITWLDLLWQNKRRQTMWRWASQVAWSTTSEIHSHNVPKRLLNESKQYLQNNSRYFVICGSQDEPYARYEPSID